MVFKIDGRGIPIVHLVLKLHEKEDGSIKVDTMASKSDLLVHKCND